MKSQWTSGNSITLLENGDEFFPRLIEIIDSAHSEILLETFIFRDDPSGKAVQQALIRAGNRGVWISVLADGFGSYYLPEGFIDDMKKAGVHFYFYDPQPRWLLVRANIFRRLHRKIVVVDGLTAFIGGINLTYDHVSVSTPVFMPDYAAELRGPVVADIWKFARNAISAYLEPDIEFPRLANDMASGSPIGRAGMLFLVRDNHRLRTTIETEYLKRIRQARQSIMIANAYFFPGYRLLKALRNAVRRGVKVSLLIPGNPDSPLAKRAAKTLYDFLVESKIDVYEYWESQFHGKIAAFDEEWATVGSSNLDPVSLSLNLEANVFVQDPDFNSVVRARIQNLINQAEVRKISRAWFHRKPMLNGFRSFLVYHFLRHFPGLAMWIPPLASRARETMLHSRSQRPRSKSNNARRGL